MASPCFAVPWPARGASPFPMILWTCSKKKENPMPLSWTTIMLNLLPWIIALAVVPVAYWAGRSSGHGQR